MLVTATLCKPSDFKVNRTLKYPYGLREKVTSSVHLKFKTRSLRSVLRDVISSIQASPFVTLMADEMTDCTNKEQVVHVVVV